MSTAESRGELPLATSTWDEAEVKALHEVIDSGRFTMGDHVQEFERAFADTVGSRYAVMVNSGSSANLLAVATAVLDEEVRLFPGDEVIVPAVSWATTYYPLSQHGLIPVLVDVDPETLNLDVDAARRACSPRTRAIMAVNLLGNSNDFDRLDALCADADLVLLEDNCESLGATFEGRSAGTFGRMGTYSSYFSHHISTMEGGVVVTNDDRSHDILTSLRSHGWTRGLPAGSHLRPQGPSGFHDLFHFVLPGYNVRPLEMSGAVGMHQLAKLDAIITGRRQNAETFQRLLSGVAGVRLQREVGRSSWFGFSIVLEGRLRDRRDEVVRHLGAAGVETRPIVAGNFARNPVFSMLQAVVPEPLNVANEIHDHGFFVGNHHYPVDDGLSTVAEVLSSL